MPTRKIQEDKKVHQHCYDPEHNVPSMQVFTAGLYEHECPSCHNVIKFRVHKNHNMMFKAPIQVGNTGVFEQDQIIRITK